MPIQNKIQFLPLDTIAISRESRQRSILSPENVLDLAVSIGTNQWVSPLLVDETTSTIIAGERRHTAVSLLRRAAKGDFSAFPNPDEAKLRLIPVSKCRADAYENWTRVPCQLGKNLTETEKLIFEFIENQHREDLPWQDKAKACYEIHAKFLKENQQPTKWTLTDTAQALGLSIASVSSYLQAWREHEAGDDKTKQILKGSTSLRSATQAIERVKSRKEGPLSLDAAKSTTAKSEPAPNTTPVLHADFIEYASTYADEPFNFIHCDFPYGIDYNKGQGMGTAADTKASGAYLDSEDIYFELLDTLAHSRENLIAPSAHIMFWFSQTHLEKTKQTIATFWPDAVIQPFLMIWHCSDNSGIVPDSQRYGRRTYETALLITLGDRKIVTTKALSFAFPRNQTRIHRSQKHLEVLSHFFEMFVDDSTRMLDPTVGSGTSLIVAKRLKAKEVVGLELDAEMAAEASKFYLENVK